MSCRVRKWEGMVHTRIWVILSHLWNLSFFHSLKEQTNKQQKLVSLCVLCSVMRVSCVILCSITCWVICCPQITWSNTMLLDIELHMISYLLWWEPCTGHKKVWNFFFFLVTELNGLIQQRSDVLFLNAFCLSFVSPRLCCKNWHLIDIWVYCTCMLTV